MLYKYRYYIIYILCIYYIYNVWVCLRMGDRMAFHNREDDDKPW